jgi:Putative restriction endonuclease
VNTPISGLHPAERIRFSSADFQRMIEMGAFEDMWVELVEGRLARLPAPIEARSTRKRDLVAALRAVLPSTSIQTDIAIDLGDDTVLGADVAVLKQPAIGRGTITPDEILLVGEVVKNTWNSDPSYKRRRYAAAGIATCWMIDEKRRFVHVFDRPEGGDYRGIDLVRFGAPLAVPGSSETIALG